MRNYAAVLGSLQRYFPSRVVISGGEPLIYPWIEQILNYLGSAHNQIVLSTNLTKLPKNLEILSRRICWFDVSLHGYDRSSYAAMREKDCYCTVLENIQRLQEAVRDARIAINYVLHQENLKQLDRVLESLAKLNVRKLRLANLVPTGTAAKNDFRPIVNSADIRNVYRLLEEYASCFPVIVPPALKKRAIADKGQIVIDHNGMLITSERMISVITEPSVFYAAIERMVEDNIALYGSIETL